MKHEIVTITSKTKILIQFMSTFETNRYICELNVLYQTIVYSSQIHIDYIHFAHPKHLIDRSTPQTIAQIAVALYDAISRCMLRL